MGDPECRGRKRSAGGDRSPPQHGKQVLSEKQDLSRMTKARRKPNRSTSRHTICFAQKSDDRVEIGKTSRPQLFPNDHLIVFCRILKKENANKNYNFYLESPEGKSNCLQPKHLQALTEYLTCRIALVLGGGATLVTRHVAVVA